MVWLLLSPALSTPPSIRTVEGSEFTIDCTFNTNNNSFRWYATWNKTRNNVTAKVRNGTDRIILSTDKEKRSLSLTVKKADVTDSGTYVCGVGSKDVIYPGTGTQVTIEGKYQHFLLCSTKPFRDLRTLAWFQGAGVKSLATAQQAAAWGSPFARRQLAGIHCSSLVSSLPIEPVLEHGKN
uniref:Ig-like domain-containing protein n=1 Tax=Chelonoidis abingdonii TaxID=106734 RepID=A0A8C0J8S3_CHEAB